LLSRNLRIVLLAAINSVQPSRDSPRWEPAKGSSDGTDQGFGTPLFSYHPSMTATLSATLRDRDRRASRAATGRRIVPSIPESLWGRARGCFSGPVGVRNGTRQRGGQQSTRGILGQEARRPAISRAELIQHVSDLGGGSRQVVPHLATQPRSLYQC
jgi:hypothetical protein